MAPTLVHINRQMNNACVKSILSHYFLQHQFASQVLKRETSSLPKICHAHIVDGTTK